jgi:hypothetical protein
MSISELHPVKFSSLGADAVVGVPVVPAIIRGKIIQSDLVEFGGRNDGGTFRSPGSATLKKLLPLGAPTKLRDVQLLSVDEILDYLRSLGSALDLETNSHLQEALERTIKTAPVTPPLLRNQYARLPSLFGLEQLEDLLAAIGRPFLEGWVEGPVFANGAKRHVRAFGARALHIIAGNSPMVAASTIIRNAITRGDAILKTPSNDPFTALAIVRTMLDMAPDHPLTKHVGVAYWKGGDAALEAELYQPHHFEKIVAWGGLASVKHVTRYIQPGLELISLDPKRSISVVGAEALVNDASMDDAAVRIAADFGGMNQEVCANARVVYVMSGTDEDGVQRLCALGQRVYDKLLSLPEKISTAPKHGINRDLRSHIDAASMADDFYHVIGGRHDEGAVIVSKLSEPVDFFSSLANRVANLVPVDSIEEILPRIDAYCQTIGVYPESLVPKIQDDLAMAGGQRIVTLGFAATSATGLGSPQDGIEPARRLCRWIFREEADPIKTRPVWLG